MGSDRMIKEAQIPASDPSRFEAAAFGAPSSRSAGPSVLAAFPRDTIVLLHEIAEISEQAKGYYERVYDASKGILEPRAMLA
ncbi:MAG: hypothetical protein EA423_00370, partial [Phycisphaerales bacterium]